MFRDDLLEASKRAINAIPTDQSLMYSVKKHCILDSIAVSGDPKRFVVALCEHMDSNKIAHGRLDFLHDLKQGAELTELVNSRNKNGRLDNGFTLEMFNDNVAEVSTIHANIDARNAARGLRNGFGTFSNASRSAAQAGDLTVVGPAFTVPYKPGFN